MFERKKPFVKNRGIHVDLKGFPPKFPHLLKIIELLSKLKINFLLLELEDMFPWKSCPELKSKNAYSTPEIKRLCDVCRRKGMEIIPLIQSFGHSENLLSQPRFMKFREEKYNVSDICPTKGGARDVLLAMINEVIDNFPGVKHIHLGGDEVSSLGVCPKCRAYAAKHGRSGLYLLQMMPLLKCALKRGVRPILWADMFGHWKEDEVRQIRDYADLMLWRYGLALDFELKLPPGIPVFQKAGVNLWGAGAYRCGEGNYRYGEGILPNLAWRAENMRQWAAQAERLNLKGLVATGWSRDAFLSLAYAPLDNALESLALSAKVMWDGDYDIVRDIRTIHGFLGPLFDERLHDANQLLLQVVEHLIKWCPETISAGRWISEDMPVNRFLIKKALQLSRRDLKKLDFIEKRLVGILRNKCFPDDIHHWMKAMKKKYSDLNAGVRKRALELLKNGTLRNLKS